MAVPKKMASWAFPEARKFMYKVPKPDIFSRGVPSKLPEAYRKFVQEWNATPSAVHYIEEPGKWKRDPLTGVVTRVQNVPLPLQRPKELHKGIWGGEAVVLGFRKKAKSKWFVEPSTKWWMPTLQRSVVSSEILNKKLSVVVTKRTIDLIIEHKGFDNYILETSAADLKSLLALKLRKKMLLALFDKTLYPDDPVKQKEIYDKYKHHLDKYNKEDLEWYALSLGEAVAKFQAMEDAQKPEPLKYQFRKELIEELKELAERQELDSLKLGEQEESKSWLNRINPFAKKS